MPPPDEITAREAAELLGVTVSTISRWATPAQPRLTPSRKLPGQTGAYLFRRRDVERLAKELEGAAT